MARENKFKQNEERRRIQITSGLEACLSSTEGRAFLGWVMLSQEMGRLDQVSFMVDSNGSPSPLHNANIEGRRAIAASIRDRIVSLNPELWLRVYSEFLNEARYAAGLNAAATAADQPQQEGGDEY